MSKEATAIAHARVRQTELISVLDPIIPEFFATLGTVIGRSIELENNVSAEANQHRYNLTGMSRVENALVLQKMLILMSSFLTDLSAELSASVELACKTHFLMHPTIVSGIDEFKMGFRFKAGELDELISIIKDVGTSIETEKMDNMSL